MRGSDPRPLFADHYPQIRAMLLRDFSSKFRTPPIMFRDPVDYSCRRMGMEVYILIGTTPLTGDELIMTFIAQPRGLIIRPFIDLAAFNANHERRCAELESCR